MLYTLAHLIAVYSALGRNKYILFGYLIENRYGYTSQMLAIDRQYLDNVIKEYNSNKTEWRIMKILKAISQIFALVSIMHLTSTYSPVATTVTYI